MPSSGVVRALLGGIVLYLGLAVVCSAAFGSSATAFTTDFSGGAPPEFASVTSTEAVQGYGGLGTGSDVFGGDFLRNTTGDIFSGGPAPSKTTLTLTGLPSHTSVSLSFLLAIIDSWDGDGCFAGPDIFNVTVDGVSIFSEILDNSGCGTQSYVPPAAVELARRADLGFNGGFSVYLDSAYDMGLDPAFQNIPHTSSTLTIDWFAGGAGWQGSDDESWAIDNVSVILNGVTASVPIDIDIKPGGSPNSVNPRSHGKIPVAIVTDAAFDAATVNPTSVLFGANGTEAAPTHSSFEDVDGDGDIDLILHFNTQDTNIGCGATSASLTGETVSGQQIEGSDSVRPVGCS